MSPDVKCHVKKWKNDLRAGALLSAGVPLTSEKVGFSCEMRILILALYFMRIK